MPHSFPRARIVVQPGFNTPRICQKQRHIIHAMTSFAIHEFPVMDRPRQTASVEWVSNIVT